jgi:hypothetical protein
MSYIWGEDRGQAALLRRRLRTMWRRMRRSSSHSVSNHYRPAWLLVSNRATLPRPHRLFHVFRQRLRRIVRWKLDSAPGVVAERVGDDGRGIRRGCHRYYRRHDGRDLSNVAARLTWSGLEIVHRNAPSLVAGE